MLSYTRVSIWLRHQCACKPTFCAGNFSNADKVVVEQPLFYATWLFGYESCCPALCTLFPLGQFRSMCRFSFSNHLVPLQVGVCSRVRHNPIRCSIIGNSSCCSSPITLTRWGPTVADLECRSYCGAMPVPGVSDLQFLSGTQGDSMSQQTSHRKHVQAPLEHRQVQC